MSQHSSLSDGLLNFTAVLIVIFLSVYILIIGTSILLPLVVSIVIWYMMIRLTAFFSKVPFTGIKVPKPLAALFSIIATAYIIYLFVLLISNSIYGIIDQAPLYQAKVNDTLHKVNTWFGTKLELNNLATNINFTSLFSNLAVTLTNIASNLGLILVYVLFLSLEYKTFDTKLKAMSRTEKRFQSSKATFEQIANDINAYMRIKTGVSLLTGLASYIALKSFGVPYAQFWAFLIFILNYIPTIGSIVAIAITLLAISVQFSSLTTFLLLTSILIAIQFIVGNIMEPRWMGKNLNLSPLVILLSLAFWGSIWGVIGMFLCVPLMTMINIVLSKFESTKMLALLFAAEPDILDQS